MSLPVRSVLRKAVRRLRPAYYADARTYWDKRHHRHGSNLQGVGSIGLDHEANIRDYDEKWAHVGAVLEAVHADGARTLLDAGCGIGFFSSRAHAIGFEVHGVDFSDEAIAVATKSAADGLSFRCAELAGMGHEREFDVVMCIDVLFHVVDESIWRRTVAALAAAVTSDGRLVIQEHLVAQRDEAPTDGRRHTRWRTIRDYKTALADWSLLTQDTYAVSAEGSTKDLLVWARR